MDRSKGEGRSSRPRREDLSRETNPRYQSPHPAPPPPPQGGGLPPPPPPHHQGQQAGAASDSSEDSREIRGSGRRRQQGGPQQSQPQVGHHQSSYRAASAPVAGYGRMGVSGAGDDRVGSYGRGPEPGHGRHGGGGGYGGRYEGGHYGRGSGEGYDGGNRDGGSARGEPDSRGGRGGRWGGPGPSSSLGYGAEVFEGRVPQDQRQPAELGGHLRAERSKYKPGILGRPIKVLANHFPLDLRPTCIWQYGVDIVDDGPLGRKSQLLQLGPVELPDTSKRNQKAMNWEVNRRVMEALAANIKLQHYGYDGQKLLYTPHALNPPVMNEEVVVSGRAYKVTCKEPDEEPRKLDTQLLADFFAAAATIERNSLEQTLAAMNVIVRSAMAAIPGAVPRGKSIFFPPPAYTQQIKGCQVARGIQAVVSANFKGLTITCDDPVMMFVKEQTLPQYISSCLGASSEWDLRKLKKIVFALEVEQITPGAASSSAGAKPARPFTIQGFDPRSPRQYMFNWNGRNVSIEQYYWERYNHRLDFPNLPCVVKSKKNNVAVPMELIKVRQQPLRQPPDGDQVNELIGQAAVPPKQRKQKILQNIKEKSKLRGNATLRAFGIELLLGTGQEEEEEELMLRVAARMLPRPLIELRNKHATAVDEERGCTWSLDRRQFFKSGQLRSWAVVMLHGRGSFDVCNRDDFVRMLDRTMRDCGIDVRCEKPVIVDDIPRNKNLKQTLEGLAGVKATNLNARPQLDLVVVCMGTKDPMYGDVKRLCDSELGIRSQCVSMEKSGIKGHPKPRNQLQQYCRNMAMKINNKLGGSTHAIYNDPAHQDKWLPEPMRNKKYMIMGIDVNHEHGLQSPSVAGVVGSMNLETTRYAAHMLLQPGVKSMEPVSEMKEAATKLFQAYQQQEWNKGKELPEIVLVYRDGIGEAEIDKIFLHEYGGICAAWHKLAGECGKEPQICFITVQKRHNTRLFSDDKLNSDRPGATARNGNVPVGTVVEEVCSPTDLDFIMVSHEGIKGTCRPARYLVATDEVGFTLDEIQRFTFWQCFLYCRCTRPVSIPAATYYADRVAARARLLLVSDDNASVGSGSSNYAISQLHSRLEMEMFFV